MSAVALASLQVPLLSYVLQRISINKKNKNITIYNMYSLMVGRDFYLKIRITQYKNIYEEFRCKNRLLSYLLSIWCQVTHKTDFQNIILFIYFYLVQIEITQYGQHRAHNKKRAHILLKFTTI